MQILTMAIIKGGTAKSTTAAALAQAAVKDGKKVLCVDLDPQANLSSFTGADQNRPGSYELLNGQDPAELIQMTQQGIAVISASPNLAAEKTKPASAQRLQNAIEPIRKNYDYIIIDTPPAMGELTYNALWACTGLLIPLETDISSIQGLYQIVDIANQIKKRCPDLAIIGSIITKYDRRPKINRYLRDTIIKNGEEAGAPYLTDIRAGVAIREAQSLQVSLYEYAQNSKPAKDYWELYQMVEKNKEG